MVNLIFMGSDPMALPLLEAIRLGSVAKCVGVITQPDKPHGRGQKLLPGPIKEWAIAHGVPVLQPEKTPAEEAIQWIQEKSAPLALVFAYGKILKQPLLDAFPLGIWNFHTSLLPKYRGACPIEAAILQGDDETGMTLMQIVLAMDAGDIVGVDRIPLSEEMDNSALRSCMAQSAVNLWNRYQEALISGNVILTPQDEKLATYVRKLEKDDGWLDFTKPALCLRRQIQALSDWPGCFFEYEGMRLKVGQAEILEGQAFPGARISGTPLQWIVGTGDGLLSFTHLQKPGGKMLPIEDFLRGFPVRVDAVCKGESRPPIINSLLRKPIR